MIGAEAVVIGLVDVRGDQLSIEMRLYDATQGTLLVGKRYNGTPNQLRSIVHRFANEIVYTFTGVRGVFGTEIAFTARSGKSKGKELYLVGMDGQDLRKVTDNRTSNLFPRWSPMGNGWRTPRSAPARPPSTCATYQPARRRRSSVSEGRRPRGFSPDGVWLYTGVSQAGQFRHLPGPGGRRAPAEKIAGGWGLEVSPRRPRRAADRLRLRPAAVPPGLREDDREPERRGSPAETSYATVAVLVPRGTGSPTPPGR